MKYEVVIIGSGLGGLICAHQLAKSGRSVVVLERERQLGGCLQSYRRGEVELDTGMHYVGGLAEGQHLYDAFDALGLMKLPWHKLDADGFDLIIIGGQTFPMAEGYDRFADTLSSYFPQAREALWQYVEMLRRLPSIDEIAHVNAYDYLTTLFRDPLLVNVVAGAAMRMELQRESLPLFNLAHGTSSYIQSSWRLKGSGNGPNYTAVAELISGHIDLRGRITVTCPDAWIQVYKTWENPDQIDMIEDWYLYFNGEMISDNGLQGGGINEENQLVFEVMFDAMNDLNGITLVPVYQNQQPHMEEAITLNIE